jgi:hypothetical protein
MCLLFNSLLSFIFGAKKGGRKKKGKMTKNIILRKWFECDMNDFRYWENKAASFLCRWKNMLGNALNAVEVVTFDYPCEFLSQLLCHSCFMFF